MFKRLISILILFITAACSSVPTDDIGSSVVQSPSRLQQQLAELTHYTASGRLLVKGNDKSLSGRFYLQVNGSTSLLTVKNPLGITLLKLTRDLDRYTLEFDKQSHSHYDGNQLIYQLTGIDLPVNQLPHWIKGSCFKACQYAQYDSFGRLAKNTLSDSGWQLSYQGFQPIDRLSLPTQIQLNVPDKSIKLRINKWQVNPQ